MASQTCLKLQHIFGTQSCEAVGNACLQKAISVFATNNKSFYCRLKKLEILIHILDLQFYTRWSFIHPFLFLSQNLYVINTKT